MHFGMCIWHMVICLLSYWLDSHLVYNKVFPVTDLSILHYSYMLCKSCLFIRISMVIESWSLCVCVSLIMDIEKRALTPSPLFRLRILILKFIIIIMVKTNYLIWQLYCIYPLKLHQKRPQTTKDPNVFWGSISLDSPRFACCVGYTSQLKKTCMSPTLFSVCTQPFFLSFYVILFHLNTHVGLSMLCYWISINFNFQNTLVIL